MKRITEYQKNHIYEQAEAVEVYQAVQQLIQAIGDPVTTATTLAKAIKSAIADSQVSMKELMMALIRYLRGSM